MASQPRPSFISSVWGRLRDFSGLTGDATYLWPRWLVLRAVGFVYLFVFGGIIAEARAILGPNGIVPLAAFFTQLRTAMPGPIAAWLGAPSWFWLNSSPAMITVLGWTGFIAAVALLLNLWPRLALFGCWSIFLSFAATWQVFSPAQLDNLMLEVALLCIPFAPAGWRPGLGASSPPLPIASFMMRWLLFRVMFESGIVKIVAGDSHWRDLTAMEVMYETGPFPTIFGYWDHHLPHAYHLFEIALTFVAELVAPILAVFSGRRGRWIALVTWTIFQVGIQLTNNFGWLNTASIGLGLLLLDDQMIAAAAEWLRLPRLRNFLTARASPPPTSRTAGWRHRGLRIALWAHFAFTLFFFAKACGLPPTAVPAIIAAPVKMISGFRSVNEYSLYAAFDPVRYQVEFEGSNDAGRTWRSYEYRYLPQQAGRIAPFIAPRFARFEATLQIVALRGRKSPVIPAVAAQLLARNPDVVRLFRRDPFPDHPPKIIRMRGYRLTFIDLDTHHRSGAFWRKEFVGDYMPALYADDRGELSEFTLAAGDEALQRGDYAAAFTQFKMQFELGNLDAGFRLADMFARGMGMKPDPEKAFALLTDLASRGEVGAEHNLGACYEYGVGVPIDYLKAAAHYQSAADRGYVLSLYSLGGLYAQNRIIPGDDVAGMSLLLQAMAHAKADDPASRFVREDRAGYLKRLLDRMTPREISNAKARASEHR